MFGTQETKKRIHSRPAKEVDFSNVAINLRQKISGADLGFVKKREAELLSSWLVRFDEGGGEES